MLNKRLSGGQALMTKNEFDKFWDEKQKNSVGMEIAKKHPVNGLLEIAAKLKWELPKFVQI